MNYKVASQTFRGDRKGCAFKGCAHGYFMTLEVPYRRYFQGLMIALRWGIDVGTYLMQNKVILKARQDKKQSKMYLKKLVYLNIILTEQ